MVVSVYRSPTHPWPVL